MTKIGTVHVEVKPAPSVDAWEKTCQALEDQVAEAVRRGIARGMTAADGDYEAVDLPGGPVGLFKPRVAGDTPQGERLTPLRISDKFTGPITAYKREGEETP